MSYPSREQALELFKKYNTDQSLLKHALAVEAVMRFMAEKHGENADKWALAGLVHDLDYQMYPDQHCQKAEEILTENKWPTELIRAVVSHGWGICADVEPKSLMEKTLYAIDELTGLIAATALVRPSKSVNDLTAKSVKKKWKNSHFAAGVDRRVIEKGAELLGIELSALITDTIAGMRRVAAEIDLAG